MLWCKEIHVQCCIVYTAMQDLLLSSHYVNNVRRATE